MLSAAAVMFCFSLDIRTKTLPRKATLCNVHARNDTLQAGRVSRSRPYVGGNRPIGMFATVNWSHSRRPAIVRAFTAPPRKMAKPSSFRPEITAAELNKRSRGHLPGLVGLEIVAVAERRL